MSRIGKAVINIPAGVTVDFSNALITVKGPKGTLTQAYDTAIVANVENNVISFAIKDEKNATGPIRAKHG